MFHDAPRADRKGGEGVSTAFHSRYISLPAVASGPLGRDSVKLVLCAA